jgi:hypothetical protein
MDNGIERTEEGVTLFVKRYAYSDGAHETGVKLYMKDGSVWFHPYNGKGPVKVD